MIRRADQIRELKREIGVRKSVYPGWVAKGNLTQEAADHRIACLEAILARIEPDTPPSLFDD